MTGFAAEAIQKAIYAQLTGDATLTGMINAVWDEPDSGAAFPYVTIGDSTTADWSTKTEAGAESTITLHAWSQAGGRMEVKRIMEAMYDALHQAALSVDGQALVLLRHDFSDDMRDPDGYTYHGVMRFRALTQES